MIYPKRLYHPDLGTEIEAADAGQETIYKDSGWLDAPEPAEALPGHDPEPVRYVQGDDGRYAPEQPEPEPEPEPEPAKPKRRPAKLDSDD